MKRKDETDITLHQPGSDFFRSPNNKTLHREIQSYENLPAFGMSMSIYYVYKSICHKNFHVRKMDYEKDGEKKKIRLPERNMLRSLKTHDV